MSTAPEHRAPPAALDAPSHWVDAHPEQHMVDTPRGWLRAVYGLAEVFFEGEEGPPPDARLRWTCWQIDDFMTRVGGQTRLVFRLSLWAITWLAPLLALRPPTIHRLSPDRRVLALERLERSPLGPALLAVKAGLSIVYYEHPDAAREIGVDGRCHGGRP